MMPKPSSSADSSQAAASPRQSKNGNCSFGLASMNVVSNTYHSPVGCATCRRLRLKCDETKPKCNNCKEKGVACRGYPIKLRWIGDPKQYSTTFLVTTREQDIPLRPMVQAPPVDCVSTVLRTGQPWQTGLQLSIPRTMKLLPHLSNLELYLLDFFIAGIPKAAFVNSDTDVLNTTDQLNRALPTGTDSLILDSIFALTSALLGQSGLVSERVMLARKSKALHSMGYAVSATRKLSKNPSSVVGPDAFSQLQMLEMSLYASVMLVGMALFLGDSMPEVLALISGSAELAKVCWRLKNSRNCKMIQAWIELLAYFDVLSCVPCPRTSALPLDIWLNIGNEGTADDEMNAQMGCLPRLFGLVVESSGLLYHYYSGQLASKPFALQRENLLGRLRQWQHPLRPTSTPHTAYEWATSIQAALAYQSATQIYLLRGQNSMSDDEMVALLMPVLLAAIDAVHMDSRFTSIIIWPAFVMGCESRDAQERAKAEALFQKIWSKHRFASILLALKGLRVVWALMDARAVKEEAERTANKESQCPSPAQSGGRSHYSWVMLCWQQNIAVPLQ